MADNPARPKTLADLLKADLRLNADKKMRNVHYEELRELREARVNIDFEIEDTEAVRKQPMHLSGKSKSRSKVMFMRWASRMRL
jgi:hypothetical protein